MKGSCKEIPCEYSKGECQCKEYCQNCCGGLIQCYNIHNFKQKVIQWRETPKTNNYTQQKLFNER